MGIGLSPVTDTIIPQHQHCHLIVRAHEGPAECIKFVLEGLEVGQQVVALAGADCLTALARALGQNRVHLQNLLRSGRLVFLTAPDCLVQLSEPNGSVHRSLFRRPAPLVRWLSDWSWAYTNGKPASVLLQFQHRVHEIAKSLEALSLCTVNSSALERRALLAVLADHRQASKGPFSASRGSYSRLPQ